MTTPRHPDPKRRRVYYTPPVIFFEYDRDDDPIWPCSQCLPWHVEVTDRDGTTVIREWHAVDCPVFEATE